MNGPIGKPFPIRIDLLQHQHVAVVIALDHAAEITFPVREPDQIFLSKGELLSFHALKERHCIVRVFRVHRFAINPHGKVPQILWRFHRSMLHGQAFVARPGADAVKSDDFPERLGDA